ncbi:MAG: undecaprenyldiphospho-muramoylpentapeptide beta-N-acetylglucosaminyltransferase [Candidatus Omnitrophica bacterium]|nr:undecaprenyldiphospho-muramoylpentapeptide beta-N-acetylglucosaminyltransferase [Candidatus Omnitrophota bacterium]MDD5690101.1 undecaprenyldiphospho-muramoylpentapeptide beta-N-acetylglucosaminyltransferase [Candidatus Omnitrophota bacterium]
MKVLLVTGSSGGHIFPALALMDRLKESGADVLMVLPNKNNNNKILAESERIKYIHSFNLDLRLGGKNISGVYFFLLSAWDGLRAIVEFKPDVVIGFGSLYTVALLFWAWLFRIKTIIHEQNVLPGRANRLLAKFVDRVALSFARTNNYLRMPREKIAVTGNPVRKGLVELSRKEALDFFNFTEGKFNILITGGSQGAHKLNTVSFDVLSAWQEKSDLQLVHISGARDFKLLKQSYAQAGIACKVFDFFPDMQYAYSVADLVICRAGATTIAELQRFNLPALLIPYPFAYDHQLANARVLEDSGCALIIRDEDFCTEKLKAVIGGLLDNRQRLTAMRQAYARIRVLDAAGLLANEVLNLN